MALAWKAGWGKPLRGSNPLSSAPWAQAASKYLLAPILIAASTRGACKVLRGGVSERPKEHASKACVGETPPWVQIPPPPPNFLGSAARSTDQDALGDGEISVGDSLAASWAGAGSALAQPGPEVDGDGDAIAAAI